MMRTITVLGAPSNLGLKPPPDGRLRGVDQAPGVYRELGPELHRFWIHVDVDVLDPAVMPAVNSPEPGGLGIDDLADLLTPLVSHPNALGMELTIYDPDLDPDGVCAERLVDLLEGVVVGGTL